MSPSASHLTKMPTLDRLLKYTKAPGAESLRFFQASSKYVWCIDAMEVRQRSCSLSCMFRRGSPLVSGRIERMPPTPSRPQQVPSWQIPGELIV